MEDLLPILIWSARNPFGHAKGYSDRCLDLGREYVEVRARSLPTVTIPSALSFSSEHSSAPNLVG